MKKFDSGALVTYTGTIMPQMKGRHGVVEMPGHNIGSTVVNFGDGGIPCANSSLSLRAFAHSPERCPSNHRNGGDDICADCGENLHPASSRETLPDTFLAMAVPKDPVEATRAAAAALAFARACLKAASAKPAAEKIRPAIIAAKEAMRHAEGKANRDRLKHIRACPNWPGCGCWQGGKNDACRKNET